GLAGDGGRFEKTLIVAGDAPLADSIAAIGLYGDAIKVGFGSLGGWDPFGPQRTITRSAGNVLYELDGRSALDLYRSYLGEHAAGLPATALLFPLQIRRQGEVDTLVRSILNVDEETGSMTFAGDVPVGATVQLMKTNYDNIVEAASSAARACRESLPDCRADLAVLISCVGRKLVLKQRIEEEVEAVERVLGTSTLITGFYSYGEICPATTHSSLELHNQTMTITTLSEQ
ncbi:MAG: FIST signal transduction protein, partial [Cyanobium sp.]